MSELTVLQMEAVLKRTVDVLNALDALWDLHDPVVPHPPATSSALQRLAAAVSFPLPPSYVQLLSICDGIDNVYGISGDLLPSSYRFQYPDFDKIWTRPTMFFIIADNDWNAVTFDTNTQNADGEMEVVEIADNIDADRWQSLSAFLIGYQERVEGWLAGERADRAKVDDD